MTPYTLIYKEGKWIAHSLAFDLVGASHDRAEAVSQLRLCLIAQLGYGLKIGRTIRDCYFAAPARYWKAPFSFMEMPTQEEMAEVKFTPVNFVQNPDKP